MIIPKIFASQPEEEFRYPIEITVETSQQKVVVGDIVEVIVSAKLDNNHYNYDPNYKYVILNHENVLVYALNEMKIPPENLERKIKWHNEKYGKNKEWEIINSDNDVIIDIQDEIVNYSFSIKIDKKLQSKFIKIPIYFVKFDAIEDYGGYVNYICNKSTNRYKHERNTYYLKLEYDDPSLKEPDYNFNLQPVEVKDEPPENIKTIEFEPLKEKDLGTNFRTVYDVLINTTLEIPRNNAVSNVSCDAIIGNAYGNGNIIVFNSSGNTGTTGNIYFTENGTDYYIEIQLVSSYDVEGHFYYEDADGTHNAYGKVLFYNYENSSSPIYLGQDVLDSNGYYSFSGIQTYKLAIVLSMEDDECIIIERGSEDNLIYKRRGSAFTHLEFWNADNEDINVTYSFYYHANNGFNFFYDDADVPLAYNVFNQQKRAENYSQNILNNPERELIIIFSHYMVAIPIEPNDISWFAIGIIEIGGSLYDLIHIFGNDEYDYCQDDNNVILHELGHAHHWYHAGFAQGYGQPHSWNQHTNDYLAWIEGFACFFSCIVRDNTSYYYDDGECYEMMKNGYLVADAEEPTDNPLNNDCEGAVCATLWDMYDNYEYGNPSWNNDDISFSISDIWGSIECPYEVFIISDFITVWVIQYGSIVSDLQNIFDSHGISYGPSYVIDNLMTQNFSLSPNHPNPFNPNTTISYNLPENIQNTKIEIYNVKGQKVRSYELEEKVGENDIIWNGKDKNDRSVSSGVYFYRLSNAGKTVHTRKMLMIK